MFGPDYTKGACPGCTNLGDGLDGGLVHLNHRDVTLICFSRAPIDRLAAYKERMGWQFPYVSTNRTEFPFDFGLALTPEQAQGVPQIQEMVKTLLKLSAIPKPDDAADGLAIAITHANRSPHLVSK